MLCSLFAFAFLSPSFDATSWVAMLTTVPSQRTLTGAVFTFSHEFALHIFQGVAFQHPPTPFFRCVGSAETEPHKPTPPFIVWVKERGDGNRPFELTLNKNTIDALKVAIKARKSPELDWIAADRILVYDPNGAVPVSEDALPSTVHLMHYEFVAPTSGSSLQWAGVVAFIFCFFGELWWIFRHELTPIEFLATAEKAHNPQLWNFSYPLFSGKLPPCANLSVLLGTKGSRGFIDAESRALEVLPNVEEAKGPVIVAVQSGMGMGKSYIIDIADQLLFVGRDPIVLKVSYNFSQNLGFESQPSNAGMGLLARIVLAVHKKVPPGSAAIVVETLLMLNARKLTSERVAMWVRAQNGVRNRPIIVAVDEIGNFLNEGSVRCVLSEISEFIKEIWEQSMHQQQVIGLVTALPRVDLRSLSQRQPFVVRPAPLSAEESKEFLKQQCGTISAQEVEEIVTICGGHPRSLAVAACKYKSSTPNSVPRPDEVALACNWKSLEGIAVTIATAIGEAFTQCDSALNGRCMVQLNDLAMLMIRNGHYAIPPTVLYCDEEDRTTLGNLYEMFACRTSSVPTKNLENTNFHFERFKARFHLPVLPAAMKARANSTVAYYCFDPSKPHNSFSILRQRTGFRVRDDFAVIDPTTCYFAASQNHRAFESMCVATSDNGVTQILCLFQSTINDELAAAIDGLNQAAEALAVRHWCNKPFLFIVFALGCSPDAPLKASDHPIVFVHRQNLHEYFTATLAPAAELCWMRHQEELGADKKCKDFQIRNANTQRS